MAKRKAPRREATKDRRKKMRQVHVINDKSTPRDIAIARADLTNFFLDSLEKHHGGW